MATAAKRKIGILREMALVRSSTLKPAAAARLLAELEAELDAIDAESDAASTAQGTLPGVSQGGVGGTGGTPPVKAGKAA